ncbi:MAG: aryl-sulfate sulfotransferase [Eubacterium sp.]|nr:aryl-sulfate sulfotransferase [Eubacterium sp.]
MENYFVASCKRVTNKVSCKINQREKVRKRRIQLPDGGIVEEWGLGLMDKEARACDNLFRRKEIDFYSTNIVEEQSYSVKTLARDYYLERLLRSGKYTFDHMFLIRNPFGEAPLTALAMFSLEAPAKVRVTTRGDIPETDYVSVLPKRRNHRVPILGLYPNRVNKVKIELLNDEDTVLASHEISVRTKGLPPDLRKAVSVKKVAKDPAFENILINGGVNIHTCAFDREGKIRYWLRRNPRGYGIFPLSDGHFFYMEKEISVPSFSNPQTVQSYDMDYFGRVYRTYLVENGVHHTAEEKVGGNILTGSNTMLEHTEDRVIEIDRKTGEIVWQLDIWDLFDDTYKDMMDWCHVNSAAYYEKDHSILISLRNVHAVISVDYDTKKLRWMLSDPKFWEGSSMTKYLLQPVGDVRWTYQQHAAFELDVDFDGNPDTKHMIVYDNHWAKRRKAKSFDKDPLSYVTFYDINEKEMTVKMFKSFGCPKTRIRANGIYVPDKNRVYNMAGSYAEPVDGDGGGVYEYDFETGEVLSEFGVKPGYFRAYNFTPNVEELALPMKVTGDYMCGTIKKPQKLSGEEYRELASCQPGRVKSIAIDYKLQEDLLFVKCVDHEVEKIYFRGEKGCYQTDFDDTYQTMDVFRKMVYKIATQLTDLPPDHYDILLQVKGELQKTGKYIEKK